MEHKKITKTNKQKLYIANKAKITLTRLPTGFSMQNTKRKKQNCSVVLMGPLVPPNDLSARLLHEYKVSPKRVSSSASIIPIIRHT